MKAVSNDYKDAIKTMGREIDAKISYYNEEVELIELDSEKLNSISLHYEGNILKSVMKQLDIDSNEDIPIGTILECNFGVFTGSQYEYISFGNFIVYSSEKQEDTKSYKIVCYDKMLYTMKDYEAFATYPISVRNYLDALCTHLDLDFASISDDFTNYNREIPAELFLDANGESLDYTFRDVLDQIAEITASTICINDDDELEVRYLNNTNETLDEEYLKDVNVNFGEVYGPINTITFKRSADADAISVSRPSNLPDNQKNEIAISDNQFLNDDNRADYIDEILDRLYGLTYHLNDFSSTGITYLDLCDKYNITITDEETAQTTTYNCILFNDEIQITQGLVENIHTERPKESETDYNTTTKDDRSSNRTSLIVDKINNEIRSVVENNKQVDIIVNGKIEYELTKDETYQQDKVYYTKDGDEYNELNQYATYEGDRTGNPHALGLYQGVYSTTYQLTQDETFEDEFYYEKVEDTYVETSDTIIQPDKEYYIYYDGDYQLLFYDDSSGEYIYENEATHEQFIWLIGDDVPQEGEVGYPFYELLEDTYVVYTGPRTGSPKDLDLYERIETLIEYQLTDDTAFIIGKTYFEQVYEIGDTIPANTIYEAVRTPSVSEQVEGLDNKIDEQIKIEDGKITNVSNSVSTLQTSTYTKTQINSIATGIGYFASVDTTFGDTITYYSKNGSNYVIYTGPRTGNPSELGLYEYGKVEAVASETGKFDKDGLLIQKEDGNGNIISDTSGRFNEKGMQIKTKEDEEVFFSGYIEEGDTRFDVGSRKYAKDTIVYTKNLQSPGETILGNHCLIQDYLDGTGWFVL